MKIKVLKTHQASPNGTLINNYEEGKVYDMPEKLAGIFITQKWGIEFSDVKKVEEKSIDTAPVNKMSQVPSVKKVK